MSEFEKWYKEKYPQALKQNTTDSDKYALEIWQAATAERDKLVTELQAQNSELSASINVLREALEEITAKEHTEENEWDAVEVVIPAIVDIAKQALASTPALKGNEFPNSANLDVYNSVIFSDAPYGTMIMESKIVKWLCRNKAKDYFDEMVEGK